MLWVMFAVNEVRLKFRFRLAYFTLNLKRIDMVICSAFRT